MATVFATLPASGGNGLVMTQTPDHLLLRQSSTRTISVVGKADGRITPLLADLSPSVPFTALTIGGNTLTYITGVPGGVGELRQQPLDGGAGTVLANGVGYVGPVVRSLFRRDFTQLASAHDSFWYCRPPAGDADCRNAEVVQFDLPDARTTVLGSVTSGPASDSWQAMGQGQDNPPASLLGSFANPGGRELYVVATGAAGSLKRVTQNLP